MLLQIKDKKRLRITFVSPREHFYFYSQDVIIHDKISWSVQSNGIKLVLGFSCATLIKIIMEEFAKYIAIKNIVFQSLSYDNFGALEKATINWTDLRVTEANLTTDELGKTHAHYFINYVDKGLYKYIRTKHIAISKVHSI